MSTPTPAPRDPNTTLDLIKETAWRIWVRHRHIPYESNERHLFEDLVSQIWQMMMEETRQRHVWQAPPPETGMPGNGRTRLALMILTLVLGAGVPTYAGTAQGDWVYAAVGAGGLILGVVLALLLPWGKR